MYGLKTDMELKMEKQMLERKLGELLAKKHEMEDTLNDMYVTWRLMEDPVARREFHKEIFELKNRILRMNFNEISTIRCKIHRVNELLYPSPRNYSGYFYDTIHDLDFEDIAINGIHGVRL